MRNKLILASLLWCIITPATAQVSIGIRSANLSIGINLPVYPQLVRVPGYPVYYAPDLNSNYFFYDGYYWVYQDDYWYQSDWYNGPWDLVQPIYDMCRNSYCASRFGTTVCRHSIFSAGGGMPHRAGMSTGAMTGLGIEVAGTSGIATQHLRLRPCPFINGNTTATTIHEWNSNGNCGAKTTTTNHARR